MASETTIISMREDFMMLTELLLPIGKFAYDWQPLIAGSFALLGAYFTIKKMREQIALQKKQIDWEKERAQKASRLRLSHALSELSEYYEECIKFWKSEDANACPELPKSSIDILIDAGANADQSTFAVFGEISGRCQYFKSRIRGLNVDYPTMLVDLVFLQHYTNQLFDYARFKTDEIEFHRVDLQSFNRITRNWGVLDLDEITIAHIKRVMPEFGGPPMEVNTIS